MQDYYAATLLELLSEQGIDEATLRGHSSFAKQNLSMEAQSKAMVKAALQLSGDMQLGLRLGQRLDLHSQGMFGYAIMSCATVADSLKLLVRYNRAVLPNTNIELNLHSSGAELIVHAQHLPYALERFYCEVFFSATLNNGAILLNQQNGNVTAELAYDPRPGLEPDQLAIYAESLGNRIEYSSLHNALRFDQTVLQSPISTANPVTSAVFLRECDRLFSPDMQRGSTSDRVQQELIASGSEFPNCAQLAHKLYMSESTLRRRLATEGARYQGVLDQVRFKLAREYLAGTSLPVTDIADLLGFSDSTNFRRSFKRWSNLTPSHFRASLLDDNDIINRSLDLN
jgi:AraC-like DNA-binding protein